ncbi:MAG TPA: SUMF1/EgtB/PvdO family nonheme iron enzyme [Xanthobacteraceae bacterium]|nr:SUMF1/EgtB/PvdO family nonheme iron enzyme [Xanthobacteraceae bacterium]
MARIFINYRRDDTPGVAGRLFDYLALKYSRRALFMDVDAMKPGMDFAKQLDIQVAQCQVLLAIIGPRWLDAHDQMGKRRLDSAADYVRIELASALNRDIAVIPVLVDGAVMPPEDKLSDDLKSLARRHSLELRHTRFNADADAIVHALEELVPRRRMTWSLVGAAAIAIAVVVGGAFGWRLWQQKDCCSPRSPAEVSAKASSVNPPAAGAPTTAPSPLSAAPSPAQQPPGPAPIQQLPVSAPTPGKLSPVKVELLTPARERALQPNDSFKECETCPVMTVITSGSFDMGSPTTELLRAASEGPQHQITIGHKFAFGRFSVTFDEWDACVADGGCNSYSPADQGWGRGKRPVINVSWNDANAYLAWLSRKTGKPYRLPTEAEREYAARAGTTTPFWWGSSITTEQANYNGSYTYGDDGVHGEMRGQSVPVDSFLPNPWGLFQMHGNVSEWTQDCWHDNYYTNPPTDGSAWASPDCNLRVRRGGSIGSPPQVLRSAARLSGPQAKPQPFISFRVVRTFTD